MIFTIAARELRSLFLSPLAWAILAVTQFIMAWLFLAQIETWLALQPRLAAIEGAPGVADIVVAPLLANAAIVLLLITPLVTMRSLSEEYRARTISLLFSAPVSMTEIVLGKYLGILGFFLAVLVMLTLMPLSLMVGTDLDLGKLAAGLLGLGLMLAAFAAIGLYMSSLTEQPVVAAVTTFGLLLLLWIIDQADSAQADGVVSYLSMLSHYQTLLKGVFNSMDVGYYVLMIALFIGFTIRRLDATRLPH
ncbi:MAG: ABC transporter permease subunit [Gammaproteobacteria bacterium]|jgi:ABC-2 type transport system permease protein|nr:ABC transporter permease subunit [Gammaproteobacteria bacterium]HSG11205.1 ABC transporter permease subunit [Gammaproteobacteria bacterium]